MIFKCDGGVESILQNAKNCAKLNDHFCVPFFYETLHSKNWRSVLLVVVAPEESGLWKSLSERTVALSLLLRLAVSSPLSSKSHWLSGSTGIFCPFGLMDRSVSHNATQTVASPSSIVHGSLYLRAQIQTQGRALHFTGSLHTQPVLVGFLI